MSATEKQPLPAEQDPIYAAIGLRWPRDVLVLMGMKGTLERTLLASGHVSEAGRWHELWSRIESAAFRGETLPREIDVVLSMIRQHCPDAAC